MALRVRQVPAVLSLKNMLWLIEVYSCEEAVFTELLLQEKCNFPLSRMAKTKVHTYKVVPPRFIPPPPLSITLWLLCLVL